LIPKAVGIELLPYLCQMQKQVKIGIIREGKVPPDKRVPLSPEQCKQVMKIYPFVQVLVQPSVKRCFTDSAYKLAGIELTEKMEECDILLGIKEVPLIDLIPKVTYFFFSHTIKKQPHNRLLLKKMLDLKITMVDYETLKDVRGNRLIAFGRYAGIVGCYNSFRAYGEKHGNFSLKPASECYDQKEMEQELKKIDLPDNYKIVVTGTGRVGSGCLEILSKLGLRQVSPEDFLEREYKTPVFTILHSRDYNKHKKGKTFSSEDFYANPQNYQSDFLKYAQQADMYIPCHFWDKNAPVILAKKDYLDKNFRIKIIGDISCDIAAPIASTLRASTIADPFYGYDPKNGVEADFYSPNSIGVMAVDNLPCELPKDASVDFGDVLIEKILPCLLIEDKDHVIERATICKDGKLLPDFKYLADYAYYKNRE
jgi:saccharopine dehydrogenase (NAD+, L-lysine-forming)